MDITSAFEAFIVGSSPAGRTQKYSVIVDNSYDEKIVSRCIL